MLSDINSELVKPSPWPWPAALIDMDFQKRRYWWGGAAKLEADFTSFVLGTGSFDYRGLVPNADQSTLLTLALAGLGTFYPGTMVVAFYHTASATLQKALAQLDNGTDAQRVSAMQNGGAPGQGQYIVVNSTAQANLQFGVSQNVGTGATNVKHAIALSYDVNSFIGAANSRAPVAPDTAGVLPTAPTTLRIGKAVGTNTTPLAAVARILLFGATRTQTELQGLTGQLRDA